MSKQCWNHVSSGKIMLGNMECVPHRQGWVKDTGLYSGPALGLRKVASEMRHINCDRDSQKQHKDMTRQELRKH